MPDWDYPDLPVSRRREEILDAMRSSRVVVVVGETGSGKTTQLPKMALELARERGGGDPGAGSGRIGCTQPRRLAATSVARRVAEEMHVTEGSLVGYQVRFAEKVSEATAIKFMTDGILLAETQGDRSLRQYDTLIIDEAHERSLNIDFLLGYLHRLLEKRKDLRLVISSATLDAGRFSEFYGNAPVVEVEGRTYQVEDHFLPGSEDEELRDHVGRAVEWITGIDEGGDILVFLPGEREIRECAKLLEGRGLPATEILPVFARLSLAQQQRVFQPSSQRRVVLATNVAETSLTIPGVVYVVDSGLARISRFNPGRQVQRLQIEQISQASARQRRGRCGRVREGVCVRLYDEFDLEQAAEFTDPEIRRSSLAGVVLRMKALRLGDVREFPFLDPPSPRAVTEGFRTLEEVGALDSRQGELTEVGRSLARLPLDPRLGRMLLEARQRKVLGEVLIIVAGLSVMDVRERPPEKESQADEAHSSFEEPDSDFMSLLNIWHSLREFRKDNQRWQRNQLRRFCERKFLNVRRILEWDQVARELGRVLREQYGQRPRALPGERHEWGDVDEIHKSILAGMPRQIGLWEKEKRCYRSTGNRNFAVFPGSGLFGKKRPEWVLGFDLVETSRLWARKVAAISPLWVEEVAPQLCKSRFHSPSWDEQQGAVYGIETVECGGLTLIPERRVHFGRVDPKAAHEVFIRDAILGEGIRSRCDYKDELQAVKGEVERAEHKLRRVGGLWSEEGAFDFFFERIPAEISTAKAFHRWRLVDRNEERLMIRLTDVVWEEIAGELALFPDYVLHGDESYRVAYRSDPGALDDGITFEIGIDELALFPVHLISWGVPGILEERVELLMRSLPKWQRQACFPIGEALAAFLALWEGWDPRCELTAALAEFLSERSGHVIEGSHFDSERLPLQLRPKLRVYGEGGEELALGEDVRVIRDRLAGILRERREEAANLEWEMTGGEVWSFGEVPVQVASSTPGADGRSVYPGLVDEGNTVGMRAFLEEEEAEESHRAGCVRLFLLEQYEHVDFVRRKFPLGPASRLYASVLSASGGLVDDLLRSAVEGAMGARARSGEEFAKDSVEGKGRLFECAQVVCEGLEEAVESYRRVSDWMERNRKDRHLGAVVEDLDEEISWLWQAGFAWKAGFPRMKRYQRYFFGIEERIARLESQPLLRDEEKRERLMPLWQRWIARWMEFPEAVRFWKIGWMLEELRLTQFAPSQPREGRVSEKRISRALDEADFVTHGQG
ncbi:MAG: ATP-dependent RNA helicase HrpA [Roseibacillus sp.]|nr:ATP-dependent RNA helicase HrpA [Roseibacillus sp.]